MSGMCPICKSSTRYIEDGDYYEDYCDDHGTIDESINVNFIIQVISEQCIHTGYIHSSITTVFSPEIDESEYHTEDNLPCLGYEKGKGWTEFPIYKNTIYDGKGKFKYFDDGCDINIYIPRSNIKTTIRDLQKNKNELYEWEESHSDKKFYVVADINDLCDQYKIETPEDVKGIRKLIPEIDKYIEFLDEEGNEIPKDQDIKFDGRKV